jgi:hypothetical protein
LRFECPNIFNGTFGIISHQSKTYSQHQPWSHVTAKHHSTWDCSARKTWYQTSEQIVQHQVQIYSRLKDMSLHLLSTPYFWSTLYYCLNLQLLQVPVNQFKHGMLI